MKLPSRSKFTLVNPESSEGIAPNDRISGSVIALNWWLCKRKKYAKIDIWGFDVCCWWHLSFRFCSQHLKRCKLITNWFQIYLQNLASLCLTMTFDRAMQIFVIMLIMPISWSWFNNWRKFAETKMEIASGLREQFHSHTVSKQERHHCDVVKFVIVVFLPFCFLIWTGVSKMIRIY